MRPSSLVSIRMKITYREIAYSENPNPRDSSIDENHRHECRHRCPKIRDEISEKVAAFLDFSCKTNWTVHELHNSGACLCSRGKKDEERAAVNEERRDYYKTGAGLEMKNACREKANVRRQILYQLTMLGVSKKAHLRYETMENWSRCCR